MQIKNKTIGLILLLSVSMVISLILIVLFIIKPRAVIVIIWLPLFFIIVKTIYLLRANTMNHKTSRRSRPRVFFGMILPLAACMMLNFAISNGQEYDVLNSFNVNVRTGSDIDNLVVCQRGKGEIFRVAGQTDDWVEIEMFSDNNRFVHKKLVYFLTGIVPGHNYEGPRIGAVD